MTDQEKGVEKKRKRKKQIYKNILDQMEFYFSPSNLCNDRWLIQKLKEADGIPISEFLKFNKIRALTENEADVTKALKMSQVLTITEDLLVKRATPVTLKDNVDECSIYIEQIPPDATHDWLKGMFTSFGKIDYVSIPKYKNSKKCKGFAFIEFAEPESVTKVTEEFKKMGCYLSTEDMDPHDLLSIATHDVEDDTQKPEEMDADENTKKRKAERHQSTSPVAEKKKKIEESKIEEPGKSETEKVEIEAPVVENTEGEIIKKKSRRKKKSKSKNQELRTGFQILSKKDWKKLRNTYLNMQRSKMKLLKKHLSQTQMKSDKYKSTIDKNDTNSNVCDLTPGLIVKIKVNEPIVDLKQFKSDVKSVSTDVKYIDVKEGSIVAHARFTSASAAECFVKNSTWPNVEILTGNEEIEYWNVIKKDREEKFSKPKVKERGRDKLIKKAEKVLGQHIIFDDI